MSQPEPVASRSLMSQPEPVASRSLMSQAEPVESRSLMSQPEPVESTPKRRFGSSTEADHHAIIQAAVPKNTRSATDYWLRMFRQFCEGRGQEEVIDWKTVSGEVLSPLLAAFYVDAKTQDGSPFSTNSLKAARGALQRHLSTAGQTINIFNDQIFSRANKVLDGVLKQRKKDGLERQVHHKPPISEADWKLLQEYFSGIDDTNDAVKLTYYVWFHLTLHFCLRGGEMQAAIKKDDVVFFTVDGKEILKLGPSYMSKNHQGGLRGTDWSSAGVIEDPQQIAAIKRYVSKLHPDVDLIFQRAMGKRELSNETRCWFAKSALSHNLLSTMIDDEAFVIRSWFVPALHQPLRTVRESYRPGRRHAHHLCTTMIDSTIQNITTCSVWDKSVHRS
ncbi:uncharacterized protein LOC135824324 [Sycon ciliatum]|uniref:uncharacterized protein LOC135824324 n=1 Tax=Sycon ciliatum TaxID=27933 RepID=UPI0031F703D2